MRSAKKKYEKQNSKLRSLNLILRSGHRMMKNQPMPEPLSLRDATLLNKRDKKMIDMQLLNRLLISWKIKIEKL